MVGFAWDEKKSTRTQGSRYFFLSRMCNVVYIYFNIEILVVVLNRHVKYYKQYFISDITGSMSFGIRTRYIILYNVVSSISTTSKDN